MSRVKYLGAALTNTEMFTYTKSRSNSGMLANILFRILCFRILSENQQIPYNFFLMNLNTVFLPLYDCA